MEKLKKYLNQQVHIAPLIVFRIIFGGMMLGSIVRFWSKGWIYDLYIQPTYFFTYYGFEWVKPLGESGMYLLFFLMALSATMIMVGLLYRFSAVLFFITFTYVELIDKTNYLNHYYFISIVAMLMIFLPAGKYFSVDTFLTPQKKCTHIPRWFITSIQLQLGIVYFFAGIAKLNPDWLLHAQPLRTWLQPHTNLPVIGFLMDKLWIAYLFSWFGAIYDLSIPFLLSIKKTRFMAFLFVIAFHVLTRILFQIGMFPYIMILATLIFFSENFHLKVLNVFRSILFFVPPPVTSIPDKYDTFAPRFRKMLIVFFIVHFVIQLLLPFRYVLYPGKLFWTEQGYRFSWRVMLMEKAGKAFFYVTDPDNKITGEAMMDNDLTPNQEKMMATQPDMILQYAHHLKKKYQEQGIKNPEIRTECYVTLNGSGSRLFLDKEINLANIQEDFAHKTWILDFEDK